MSGPQGPSPLVWRCSPAEQRLVTLTRVPLPFRPSQDCKRDAPALPRGHPPVVAAAAARQRQLPPGLRGAGLPAAALGGLRAGGQGGDQAAQRAQLEGGEVTRPGQLCCPAPGGHAPGGASGAAEVRGCGKVGWSAVGASS